MENKRKEERVVPEVLEPVEVQLMGDGFLEILTARDIGPSGVGIYVEHGFQGLNIVREVEVILSIPHEESFKTRGVIKYKRHFNSRSDQREFYGILFTRIAAQHRRLLEDYVAKRLADKRVEVRVWPAADSPVKVNIIGEHGPRPAGVKNISAGGIQVCQEVAGNEFPNPRELTLQLTLPAAEPFQLKGVLRYHRKSDQCAGISFLELTRSQKEAINEYVLARVRDIQRKL